MIPHLTFGVHPKMGWMILLVSALLLLPWFASYSVSRGRARWLVTALRLLLWGLTLIFFLRLSLVFTRQEALRTPLAVVVDRSKSISLPTEKGQTRWDQLKGFLESKETFNRLNQDFELRFYEVAEQLVPTTLSQLKNRPPPNGSDSNLNSALDQLGKEPDLAGILLLSDGVDTSGKAGELHTHPVISVFPTESPGVRDVAITEVRYPEVAYLKSKVSIEVVVEMTGIQNEEIRLRVLSKERLLSEQPIPESMISSGQARLTLTFSPDSMGPFGFVVQATRVPNELTYENNERAFTLTTLRDRTRVLHVAGRPSWDQRFLREYLKENQNLDLISFFILRNPRSNPDAGERELSLIPFPYQELFSTELKNFDLVIFQNFDFKTYFSYLYLKNLKDYVEEGGAFVMIGGDLSFGQGGYAGTPLEEILPVKLRTDPSEIAPAPFKVAPTSDGRSHPILQSINSNSMLQTLPELRGFQRAAHLQPNTSVLLAHPTEKTDLKPAPILAARQVQKGRVVALLADSLWRWAFSDQLEGARAYRQLWDGIYRWAIRDPEDSYVRIEKLAPLAAGKPNDVEIKALQKNYSPAVGANLKIQLRTAEGQTTSLSAPATDQKGTTRVHLPPMSSGLHELKVLLPGQSEEEGFSQVLAVDAGEKEFIRRTVDSSHLESIARESGGEAISVNKATSYNFAPFYKKTQYREIGTSEISIWDHPLLLFLILALASVEWWYRRRNGGA